MCKRSLDKLITPAVTEVLETMFFAGVQEAGEAGLPSEMMAARVPFEGREPGTVEIRISDAGARTLAASFLGEEEVLLTRVQLEQVLRELANMICGAIVSNAEFGGIVGLGSPEFACPAEHDVAESPAAAKDFFVENEMLSVLVYTSEHA